MDLVYVQPIRGIQEIEDLLFWVSGYDAVIAGGYARWCISPHTKPLPPSDIDIFCFTEKQYTVIQSYLHRNFLYTGSTLNADNFKYIKSVFAVNILEGNANMLDFSEKPIANYSSTLPIQLVYPRHTIRNVHDLFLDFDLYNAQAALLGHTRAACTEAFLGAEVEQRIMIQHVRNPLLQMKRLMKYKSKGYTLYTDDVIRVFDVYASGNDETRQAYINVAKTGGY